MSFAAFRGSRATSELPVLKRIATFLIAVTAAPFIVSIDVAYAFRAPSDDDVMYRRYRGEDEVRDDDRQDGRGRGRGGRGGDHSSGGGQSGSNGGSGKNKGSASSGGSTGGVRGDDGDRFGK